MHAASGEGRAGVAHDPPQRAPFVWQESVVDAFPPAFRAFLKENGVHPDNYAIRDVPRYVRVSPRVALAWEELERQLHTPCEPVSWLPGYYALASDVKIAGCDAYRSGGLYGIDLASGAAVAALDVRAGDHVLDMCCAPGAKLCAIADALGLTGSVTGVDVSAERLGACRTLCSKYGIANARLFVADATAFAEPPPALRQNAPPAREVPGIVAPSPERKGASAVRSGSPARTTAMAEVPRGLHSTDAVGAPEVSPGAAGAGPSSGVPSASKENPFYTATPPADGGGIMPSTAAASDAGTPDLDLAPPDYGGDVPSTHGPSDTATVTANCGGNIPSTRGIFDAGASDLDPVPAAGGGDVPSALGPSDTVTVTAGGGGDARHGVTNVSGAARQRHGRKHRRVDAGCGPVFVGDRLLRDMPGQAGSGGKGLGCQGLGSQGLGSDGLVSVGDRLLRDTPGPARLPGQTGLGYDGVGCKGLGNIGLEYEGLGSEGLGSDNLGSKGLWCECLGNDVSGNEVLGNRAAGYDRVLVDAECTHDGSIKHLAKFSVWGWDTFKRRFLDPDRIVALRQLQYRLLRSGFGLLREGGYLVYSTCSFAVAQNEEVVAELLADEPSAVLVPVEGLVGAPCVAGGLEHTVRFDPRTSRTSALFIAKIQKRRPA